MRALKHFYTGRSIVLHYVRREKEREGREKGGKGLNSSPPFPLLPLLSSPTLLYPPSHSSPPPLCSIFSNLWLFVSKFTPSQPQKLYKKARKERGKEVSHFLLRPACIASAGVPFLGHACEKATSEQGSSQHSCKHVVCVCVLCVCLCACVCFECALCLL